ncbi:MAG: phosphoribosyltransferase [Planctomycetaceae bacterium]|nr:phosphoribosyltransferase [Planctomycetaceae bacterium]
MTYLDRTDAGKKLAHALGDYRGKDALVLALPRGGVIVGYEVARELEADLDVLIVRKLGSPYNPEFGIGAIASGGARYLDAKAIAALHVPQAYIERVEQQERAELERRSRTYRGERPQPQIDGRLVILVDDGIATGGTARAAVRALRQANPARLVLAVPVAPPSTVAALAGEVDEIVCPEMPLGFSAIGQWYQYFDQVSDEEVIDLLERHALQRQNSGRE